MQLSSLNVTPPDQPQYFPCISYNSLIKDSSAVSVSFTYTRINALVSETFWVESRLLVGIFYISRHGARAINTKISVQRSSTLWTI